MPDTITKLNEAIANGKIMTQKVEANKVAANDTIHSAFRVLHKALDKQEKALLAQSSEIARSKLNSLQLQMEEMASLRDEVSSCHAAISEALGSHTDTQLLSVVIVLQTRLQELEKKFSEMPLQFQEDDTIAAVVKTTTLVSEISTFGFIKKHQPRDYKSLSKPMMVISGVNAVHDNGNIFVTNHHNHCVCVFDKNGQKKATIGSRGSGSGQFKYP